MSSTGSVWGYSGAFLVTVMLFGVSFVLRGACCCWFHCEQILQQPCFPVYSIVLHSQLHERHKYCLTRCCWICTPPPACCVRSCAVFVACVAPAPQSPTMLRRRSRRALMCGRAACAAHLQVAAIPAVSLFVGLFFISPIASTFLSSILSPFLHAAYSCFAKEYGG